ncbi:hypothetical protein AGDE_16914 [Angomonas deanei]|nr:hypothetical protein AGDE_16914 [Angomonas deanei]|eukprot:EPY15916.1 hypothetical protein AGDE_16914 [Angomonas deanei]
MRRHRSQGPGSFLVLVPLLAVNGGGAPGRGPKHPRPPPEQADGPFDTNEPGSVRGQVLCRLPAEVLAPTFVRPRTFFRAKTKTALVGCCGARRGPGVAPPRGARQLLECGRRTLHTVSPGPVGFFFSPSFVLLWGLFTASPFALSVGVKGWARRRAPRRRHASAGRCVSPRQGSAPLGANLRWRLASVALSRAPRGGLFASPGLRGPLPLPAVSFPAFQGAKAVALPAVRGFTPAGRCCSSCCTSVAVGK